MLDIFWVDFISDDDLKGIIVWRIILNRFFFLVFGWRRCGWLVNGRVCINGVWNGFGGG